MTDDLLARIQALHDDYRRDPDSGCYPQAFRQLVIQYALPLRAQGTTWSAIADALPISSTTVRKWTGHAKPPATSLVPVNVVDDPRLPALPVRELCLTSPAGFQLTGLSVEQAVKLMGHLQ